MRYGVLLALLLGSLAPAVRGDPDSGKQVIRDAELEPQLKELQSLFLQVRRGDLKMEKLLERCEQRAAAPGPRRERAIRAYMYGLVLEQLPRRGNEARRMFEQAIKLWEPFPAAMVAVAVLADRNKDTKTTRSWLRRALRHNSEYVPAIVKQARLAQREGDLEEAERLFKKSIDLEATSEAWIGLASVHVQYFHRSYDEKERKRHANAAVGAANAWLYTDPEDPRPRLMKANVYEDLGQPRKAVETLEEAYSRSGFKEEFRLEFLRKLHRLYFLTADIKGLQRTLARLVAHKLVTPEERDGYERKIRDLGEMRELAVMKWQIEIYLEVLENDGISIEQRRVALRRLLEFWADDVILTDKHLQRLAGKVMRRAIKELVKAPPELVVEMMQFFRNMIRDAKLTRILVHFMYPHGKTPEVRAETVRTLAACARIAALPGLLFSLRDESGMVVREVDNLLSELCERRSAVRPGIEPLDRDQRRHARQYWRDYTHTDEGGGHLIRAFGELGKIVRPEPEHTRQLRSAPMVDHTVRLVLLDNDMSWPVWQAAYEFLVRYWGKDFRPVERRGKPVEEFEREHIVAELEDFWKKDPDAPQPETPQEVTKPEPRQRDAKDEDD
ncbi:MAG: tetratricopeptide repeat protein [Planctomycetota bacterium]|jgi:tetratricopeptide (TPR) repeat protein